MIVDKALRVGGGSCDYHVMLKYDHVTVASYYTKKRMRKKE